MGGMAKAKRIGNKAKAATRKNSPKFVYFADIYPGVPSKPKQTSPGRVPEDFVSCVSKVEAEIKLPVWLLVQDRLEEPSNRDNFNMLGDCVTTAFFSARHKELKRGQKIALIIDSNGGRARPTYELAMLLRRHCGGFV